MGLIHDQNRVAGRIDVACFTPGTLIATPTGEKAIETLREGDGVLTRDNGIQEICWIGQRVLSWAALTQNPHIKPILIRKDALGPGQPDHDMQLSPNHRVLLAGSANSNGIGETEILTPVKYLVNDRTILSVEAMGVTYFHLMFDHHQVILSNGAWSESFQPGDFALRSVGNAQRLEILEIFPELQTSEGIERYLAARPEDKPSRKYRRDRRLDG